MPDKRAWPFRSADEIRKLAKFMHGIKVLPIYGGQDIVKQIRSLKDRCSGADRYAGTCHGPYETPYD